MKDGTYENRFLSTHLWKRELNLLTYILHSNWKADIYNSIKCKIQEETKNSNSNRRVKSIFYIEKSRKLQLKLIICFLI
jgi:hypothetical protein